MCYNEFLILWLLHYRGSSFGVIILLQSVGVSTDGEASEFRIHMDLR